MNEEVWIVEQENGVQGYATPEQIELARKKGFPVKKIRKVDI